MHPTQRHPSFPGRAGHDLLAAGGTDAAEASTPGGNALGRIYQSLTDFTVLTRRLRAVVDARLGAHLTVTGWQDGVLRVHLDQPALATRWRFQEPAACRALLRLPEFRGLHTVRLALTDIRPRPAPPRIAQPSSLPAAPAGALLDLAASEPHEKLRQALAALGQAAAQAKEACAHAREG